MPKDRRKDNRGGGRKGAGAEGGGGGAGPESSDEDRAATMESMSVVSATSDQQHTDGSEGTEVDESITQDMLEDKLKEHIEGTNQKSVKVRVDSLNALRLAFTKKLLTDFIEPRKISLGDYLVRCLHKGKGEEQVAAAMCAILLMIQLGADEELYQMFKQPLTIILTDESASCPARSACAEALGVMTFLADQEVQINVEVMSALEGIFRGSYHKGDGSVPTHSLDVTALHSSALSSWSLLLTVVPDSIVNKLLQSHLSKLSEVLSSADVDLRITAGETIALLYQIAREKDEDFEGDCFDELCASLHMLSTESNKYRAKKDRKMQRSSFRDILGCIQEFNKFPMETIKMSRWESLYIDTWTVKTRYNSLCHCLSSGMNLHLLVNEFVRDIFGLGRVIPVEAGLTGKISKQDRNYQHVEADRLRSKNRNKMRDKKSYGSAATND